MPTSWSTRSVASTEVVRTADEPDTQYPTWEVAASFVDQRIEALLR